MVNLERSVQMCVDIAAHIVSDADTPPPDTMGDSFDALHRIGVIPEDLATRLRRAVGFRNIAVHAYQTVDWGIVFAIITTRLGDFSEFARHVDDRLRGAGS